MKTKATLTLLALTTVAGLLLLAVAPAMAQPPQGARGQGGPHGKARPSPEALFDRFDKNDNGKLSADELPERIAEKLIEHADADGDGAVTLEELEAARPERPGGPGGPRGRGGPGGPRGGRLAPEDLIEKFDENGSTELTENEVPERLWERLSKADANGNGAVTLEELKETRAQMGDKPRGPAALFERFDEDSDGTLTQDELPERAAEHLMQLDADGDGALTPEELAAAGGNLGKGRGGRRGGGGFRGGGNCPAGCPGPKPE